MAYEIGRDGIKFMSMNSDVPQIYIANPSTGTRFSLAAAVDETALTPIGVYVADSGMYTIDLKITMSYSLPIMQQGRLPI